MARLSSGTWAAVVGMLVLACGDGTPFSFIRDVPFTVTRNTLSAESTFNAGSLLRALAVLSLGALAEVPGRTAAQSEPPTYACRFV